MVDLFNVKMGKMGGLGKAKIGSLVQGIYWIDNIGGRGRRWVVLVIEKIQK